MTHIGIAIMVALINLNPATTGHTNNKGTVCYLGAMRTCGSAVGTCRHGFQKCDKWDGSIHEFVWSEECIGAVVPSDEICDGLDNDCDGEVDEDACYCAPGDAKVCGSSVGECRHGVQYCRSTGTWDETCMGAVWPTPEICDGLDNDCNGAVDDSVICLPPLPERYWYLAASLHYHDLNLSLPVMEVARVSLGIHN